MFYYGCMEKHTLATYDIRGIEDSLERAKASAIATLALGLNGA